MKVALSSIVALFGTYQIAANGVAQSIWTMAALVSVSMGPAFITVIGQCMGARDIAQAEHYFRKLTKITLAFSIGWNIMIFLITPPLVGLYALSEETKQLTIQLVLIHNVLNALAFTFADPLGKGLRATGDVFFTNSRLALHDHRRTPALLGSAWHLFQYGRHRHCPCYGHRLDRPRRDLLGTLQARRLEEVPRNLGMSGAVRMAPAHPMLGPFI